MNRQELLDLHVVLTSDALDLMTRKNHDYAGKRGESPFANFERVEAMGVTTTGKGFLVRIIDKISRLSSFEDAGEFKVKDESVRDTVLDLINYAVLYYAQKQDKKPTERDPLVLVDPPLHYGGTGNHILVDPRDFPHGC